MLNMLLGEFGFLEVLFRRVLNYMEPIKKRIKRTLRKNNSNSIEYERNFTLLQEVENQLLSCGINDGDIIIIHSSMDGLKELGFSEEELIDWLIKVFRNNTIVFAAYPIEPLKEKQVYKYNPDKTICWTGMLPNLFLKREGVIRSPFPYNSLAALGKDAEEMMKNSLSGLRPHDEYSAWEYCRKKHAKILFLGTTSKDANTMAIHMVPDIMQDKWKVLNWYKERTYRIRVDGLEIEKKIEIQDGYWAQFVMEYNTDRILKEKGLVRSIGINSIPIEIVDDSYKMMEFLVNRCKEGKYMYRIPKKYLKKA